jgi:hypothetical protein
MDPALYPEPQMGMVVEAVRRDGGVIHIRTTGADIVVDLPHGEIRFGQRIGHERPLAILRLDQALQGAEVTHSGAGLVRVTIARPAMTIRVNGDSLCMLHVDEPLSVVVDREIVPAWNSSHFSNHLIADEWGAFGLYCSELKLDDHFDVYAETVAQYALPADGVLWLGVCPPKPYDWERSLHDNVVWHWSNQLAYPPDHVIRSWQEHGNIVLLQSELLLWKNWNLDFVPRLGEEEFGRVRNTIHALGMRFIVYTSPYYFLRGTALEPRAINTFEGFTGWPPGTPTGENMGLFLPAIRRVMRDYKPDGLYFDGQYTGNPAALYALARSAREIVGEKGILEWHSTGALGSAHCYLPQADAYVDFILRGEGRQQNYTDFDYLRFFVSGYNINNCIGVICNNGPVGVTPELARNVLRANARFHTIVSWLDNPQTMDAFKNEYQVKLTPDLKQNVEDQVNARQKQVVDKFNAMQAQYQALRNPPLWSEPTFTLRFDKLPDAEQIVSKQNPNPFSIGDGSLHIQACAHTYAFLRIPVGGGASGFVVRLCQGTDGGMSWGPAAILVWGSGAGVRLGTRSDGTLQSDVLGVQQHGSSHDPTEWIWLRARWLESSGVVERSIDGTTYERIWAFEHGGALNGPVTELLVGKVPYNGQPRDYNVAGRSGACAIAFVRVYGR